MTDRSGQLARGGAIDGFVTALMIALTFSWGLNQVAIKVATTGYHPLFLTFARSLIAAACVFAWCQWRGIRLFDRDGTLGPGMLAGALFGIEFVCLFYGLDYTTAARSALMLNTMPFWVLIGAHLFLGERMSGMKIAGMVLAFSGVAVVFSDQLSMPDSSALFGDALCLVAGMLWAATIIVIKGSRLSGAPAEKTLLYQLIVSAAVAVPLMPFAGELVRDGNAMATGALLFQAIYVVGLTYLLFFWLMTRYPAAGLSSFAFLTPVFGVLCGAVILGEPMSWRIALALVLIGAGLVVVNRPARAVPPA